MMRTIEAFWASDGLRVWGMDSERTAVTSSRKRVRPHPYALDHDALAATLERYLRASEPPVPDLPGVVTSRMAGHTDRSGPAHVWLPGIPRHPGPPPELAPLPDTPRVRSVDVQLRQWEVATLTLEATEAFALLDAVPPPGGEPSSESAPFVAGHSLHHFAAVLETAKAVVFTKRVLPQLVEEYFPQRFGPDQAEPVARWRPILDTPVGDWLRETAQAWPPIARVHHKAHDSAENAGAAAIADVLSALCAFTDRIARDQLSGHTPAIPRSRQLRHLWTDALTQGEGRLGYTVNSSAQAKTLTRLRESLQSWFVEAHQQAGSLRLAFRLVEPVLESPDSEEPDLDDDGETFVGGSDWRLELWAQSVEEPSLMVPLSEIWAGTWSSATADWLPNDPSPVLLRALGQAAQVYPGLSQVLHETAPDHMDLDLDHAVDFLTTHAPALDEAGFGVLLPPWVGERRVGVKLTTHQADDSRESSSGIGQTLVDFDFRAAVGDVELSAAELDELVQLKQPMIRLRGEWARLDPKDLRAAADYLTRHRSGTVDIAEALRMAVAPEPGRPELVDVEADGELGALLNGTAEHTFAPMAEPAGFTAELRPYQQRGAAWLRYLDRLGLGTILADDMGLGKTVQLLALLAEERADSAGAGEAAAAPPAPTLLICPTSLIGNWHREAARFTPKLSVHLHHGSDRPHGADFTSAVAAADLVVTTYGVALRDTEELAAATWARVVCDEAQAIKNSRTRQARAARSIPAASRIALTGTPMENHLGELWSVMEFSNPGLLGSRTAFDKGIAAAIERDPTDDEGGAAAARLQRVTAPFILRRMKTDTSIISDLPEKQEIKTWCTLTTEQASLYKAAVAEMTTLLEQAEGMQRKGLVLATMTKLKQVCNHPAHLIGDGSRLQGRSGKLEHLCELLAEVAAEGDKALCFTQYTDFGDRLAPYLASRLDMPVLWLHGSVPPKKREELVERFQNEAGPMVFLLSLKAAGTGMNLTAANQVIHVDRWWNPAVEDQATDRAFRIGQRRNVQVRKMICIGTLEERIDEMIDRKKRLADAVVGSGEDWLSELSVDELRDVIRLAPEAVAG